MASPPYDPEAPSTLKVEYKVKPLGTIDLFVMAITASTGA